MDLRRSIYRQVHIINDVKKILKEKKKKNPAMVLLGETERTDQAFSFFGLFRIDRYTARFQTRKQGERAEERYR